jgi:hypothetical protein
MFNLIAQVAVLGDPPPVPLHGIFETAARAGKKLL